MALTFSIDNPTAPLVKRGYSYMDFDTEQIAGVAAIVSAWIIGDTVRKTV